MLDIFGKRYSNIQSVMRYISWNEIPEFLIHVMNEVNEEELRKVYLSNPMQKESYLEFKNRVQEEMRIQSIPKEVRDAQTELNAVNIESWFRERGGGNRE